jgi:RNA-directed DNA polymerase
LRRRATQPALHDDLTARVGRKVRDKRLLGLVGRYLRAGIVVGESVEATVTGTPQGGPFWPLLANILLDDLGKELERRGQRFIRYADDLLIPAKTSRAGERVMASVTRFLTRRLKLVANTPGAAWQRSTTASFSALPSGGRSCVGPITPSRTSSITSGA